MSGLTCQQIVFVTKLVLSVNRSAVCGLGATPSPVCTENFIRVDDAPESPKLAE